MVAGLETIYEDGAMLATEQISDGQSDTHRDAETSMSDVPQSPPWSITLRSYQPY